jgi:hypothetical protein
MARLPAHVCPETLPHQPAQQDDQAPLPLARQVPPPDPDLLRTAHAGSPSIWPALEGPHDPLAVLQDRAIQRSFVQTFSTGLRSGE